MAEEGSDGETNLSPERFAIGLSFGNSNSSIAHTSGVSVQIDLRISL